MRKIIAITQVTLDGVMQAPGGPDEDRASGFTHGGWAMLFVDDAAIQVLHDTIAVEFDMLLGRFTYDIFAGYWPNQGDNPVAHAFNRATKHVVTSRAAGLTWKKSEQIGGDVVKGVRRLKEAKGPELHVWGSCRLLQTLIGAGLVDEHRLWVIPVVLGTGKRLFGPGVPSHRLTLVETKSIPSGVVMSKYRVGETKSPRE